jgi:peroxiredoxin Q/BCP
MTAPMIDTKAPAIELPGTGDLQFRLADKRGSCVVLYFYPKDDTPGCTTQGQQFRDLYGGFLRCGAEVYGISRDSLKSHERFKTKLALPFELLSDTEEAACNAFGVMRMKKMYGREVRGVERSTFVIDRAGVIRGEWRGVKVAGHVEAVLAVVESLGK